MAKEKKPEEDTGPKNYRQRFSCKKPCIHRGRLWSLGEPFISEPGEDVPHHFEWVSDIDKPIDGEEPINHRSVRKVALEGMKKDEILPLLGLQRSRLSKDLLIDDVLAQEFGV